ncbi:hypothetical protein AXX17_AT2G11110 [Arabidopsis thaliana]|uniref:Uncharacterized protein n=1 Tax=Arabidopsis thaliana TaxID=3702 RepID=A0A178VU14_ARATH|nr:hypothetical protein AXX17_AT2G11110 [Arabidopsis thaliana]
MRNPSILGVCRIVCCCSVLWWMPMSFDHEWSVMLRWVGRQLTSPYQIQLATVTRSNQQVEGTRTLTPPVRKCHLSQGELEFTYAPSKIEYLVLEETEHEILEVLRRITHLRDHGNSSNINMLSFEFCQILIISCVFF